MAKIDLKFIDIEEDDRSIDIDLFKDDDRKTEIRIRILADNEYATIYLDKSTAIKFAKTLRTEINKIED